MTKYLGGFAAILVLGACSHSHAETNSAAIERFFGKLKCATEVRDLKSALQHVVDSQDVAAATAIEELVADATGDYRLNSHALSALWSLGRNEFVVGCRLSPNPVLAAAAIKVSARNPNRIVAIALRRSMSDSDAEHWSSKERDIYKDGCRAYLLSSELWKQYSEVPPASAEGKFRYLFRCVMRATYYDNCWRDIEGAPYLDWMLPRVRQMSTTDPQMCARVIEHVLPEIYNSEQYKHYPADLRPCIQQIIDPECYARLDWPNFLPWKPAIR